MPNHDDYIKSDNVQRRLGLPKDHGGTVSPREDELWITAQDVANAMRMLPKLDWSNGLTRDGIQKQWNALPIGMYLRLPDSKHFHTAAEVLHEAGISSSRAEGDFMGAHPDVPEEESVEDGGPPGWGAQPAVFPQGAEIDGGSEEDRTVTGRAADGIRPE